MEYTFFKNKRKSCLGTRDTINKQSARKHFPAFSDASAKACFLALSSAIALVPQLGRLRAEFPNTSNHGHSVTQCEADEWVHRVICNLGRRTNARPIAVLAAYWKASSNALGTIECQGQQTSNTSPKHQSSNHPTSSYLAQFKGFTIS